jgi:hypothetical protein
VSEAVAVIGGGQEEVVEAVEMVRRRGGSVRAWVVGDAGRAQGALEKFLDLDGPVQHVGTSWPL